VDLASLLYGRLDRSWQAQANCMGVDPDLFFPERGASTREALANGEKFGIWGGMSERERRRLRRARALQRRAVGDAS
jgi:WhiB family redox-sensing transcriptional regulator